MIGELANHVWQSTLFAAAVAILTTAFHKNRARVRYCLWFSASLKFLIPFSLLTSLGGRLEWMPEAQKIAGPAVSMTVEQVTRPFSGPSSYVPATSGTIDWVAIALLVIWLCGVTVIAATRLQGWLRIQAAVRSSKYAFEVLHGVEARSSAGLLEPGVAGLFRPILLLPAGIQERLTPRQFAALLAHELCHVRRHDNLSAAVHMVLEAIFWFHPLVWWIGARLVEERERACDEEVLRLGNEPQAYAESILKTCQFYFESPLACMPGITGADLKRRLVRIMTQHVGRELTFGRKVLLAAAGTTAFAAPVLFGLVNGSRSQAEPSTKTNTAIPAFEVASVKPDKSESHHSSSRDYHGKFMATNVTLQDCIRRAYGVMDYQIVGPAWLKSERYDIAAEASFTPSTDQLRLMIQALLADRFKLSLHHEKKIFPVYVLIVAKNGPRLQPAPNGGHNSFRSGPGHVSSTQASMSGFADLLSSQAGRPVLDETELHGAYNFQLDWTPDIDQIKPTEESDRSRSSSGGPSLFTAIQEQLGLKLEPRKAPVDLLVIDHAERTPTEN
jgi:uncharacterized protein (TIGR03435 family)